MHLAVFKYTLTNLSQMSGRWQAQQIDGYLSEVSIPRSDKPTGVVITAAHIV